MVLTGRARAKDISILRDAEIENIIRTYATPIFAEAGLDPAAVHVYVVNDPTLNSFVAGGQNLFMNSGTILGRETANRVVGMTAQETGHIPGGHLARTDEALRHATIQNIIALVVGAAAAAASGNGGAGAAAILGGSSLAQRSFLQFSITQEASADQAALSFLDRTGQSAKGLLQFFEILQQQELLSAAHQDPYMRTHPLTSQRVTYVREHVLHSRFSDVRDPPDWIEMHRRMKAKLAAFLGSPPQVLAAIKPGDNSVAARYARAIAYYRVPDLKQAVPLIDGLIEDYPANPYSHELTGHILFHNGRIAEAVPPYEQAVKLSPKSALLPIEPAPVHLATNDPVFVPKALAHLNAAVPFEDPNPPPCRFPPIPSPRTATMRP